MKLLILLVVAGAVIGGALFVRWRGMKRKRMAATVVPSNPNLEWHEPSGCGGPDVED